MLGIKPILILAGPAILYKVVEWCKMNANMIENTIKDDFDSVLMSCIKQSNQILICSKQRINPEIIRGCIFVIEIRKEYWVQVYAFNP